MENITLAVSFVGLEANTQSYLDESHRQGDDLARSRRVVVDVEPVVPFGVIDKLDVPIRSQGFLYETIDGLIDGGLIEPGTSNGHRGQA